MKFAFHRSVRYVLAGLAVLVLGKLVWSHRHDAWLAGLSTPAAPAKVKIEFDNGTARDAADSGRAVRSEAGQLKKCSLKGKLIYTDQECPAGAQVVAIKGGTVNVLESPKPPVKDAAPDQSGKAKLRDTLGVSGGESLKDKMIERAIQQQ